MSSLAQSLFRFRKAVRFIPLPNCRTANVSCVGASRSVSMSTATATMSRKVKGNAWVQSAKWLSGAFVIGGGSYLFWTNFGTPERTVTFMLNRLSQAEGNETKASFLGALSIAVSQDAVKQAMVTTGGIHVLRDLLGDPDHSIRRLAIQVLADISQHLSLSADIAKVEGLFPRICQCVIDEDKEISINSIMVLTFLMNGSPEAKLAAFEHGVLQTLHRAVRATDMDVAHFSCGCIGALVKGFPDMDRLVALKKDIRDRMVQSISQIAQSHVALGQQYAAIEGFETALQLDGANPSIHNALGQLYSLVGQMETANRHFRDAVKLAPSLTEASYNLAVNLTRDPSSSRRDRNEAVETLFKSLQFLNKSHPNRHDVYFLLARTLDGLDRTPEACRVINDLLRGSKHLAKGHVELGKLKLKLDDLDGAELALRNAIQLQPHDSISHYQLGLVHYRRGNFQTALDYCKQAVKLNPDLENAFFLCGKLYVAMGDWEDALSAFGEVVRLNPTRADGHYQMGRAFEHLDRTQEAFGKFKDTLMSWYRTCSGRGCKAFFRKHPVDQRVFDSIGRRCQNARETGVSPSSAGMLDAYDRLKQEP